MSILGGLRRSRLLAIALTVLIPVTLTAGPAAAEPPVPPPTTASPKTPPEVTDPTLKAAWDKAAKSGKPVEVPSRFTETMKVWADPDGKNMRAELYTRPVQLKNKASGVWEPIDTTIVERGGKLQAARVKTALTFGRRGSTRLVSADGPTGTSGLGVKQALPEPKISGNMITYPDAVAPGADLVVQAQADGFVSQVVFRRKPAGPVTVRLPLTLPKGTTVGKTAEGLPQLKDADGKAKAAPITLTAMDAKMEASPEEGKSSPVTARVESSGKSSELVFTPDATFLADPAVSYPVTIAADGPWFGGGVPADAWVNKDNPGVNNSTAGYLRVGTTSTSADIARVYLKFDTDDPVLEGAKVLDADLYVWNFKSGGPGGVDCGDPMPGSGIGVALVTSPWTLDGTANHLSWSKQPSNAGVAGESGNYAGYNYEAKPPSPDWCVKEESLVHDIDPIARAWIEQNEANHGVVLRAPSESAVINWRQYYSSDYGGGGEYPNYRHPPALIVEYQPAPSAEPQWVKFEADNLTEFPTYEQAKAMEAEPLSDNVNWALTNQEADNIEKLGRGVANEVSPNYLQPLPSDVAIDPATLDPDEVPAGTFPRDDRNPTVTDVRPVADSSGVPVGTTISVTFSEHIWNPKITVTDSNQTVVQGTAALDTTKKVLTFAPAQPLKPGTAYSAEASEAVDEDDNKIAPHSWRFTTEDDSAPPTISSVTPAAQATGVSVSTAVTATFSEAVTNAQLTLKDPAGTAVSGTAVMDAAHQVLTFTPAQPLIGTTAYTAEVSGAKDSTGNAMAEPYTWSFTTGANGPAPGLVAAYGMDEGSGTSVKDSSGKNHTGSATATSWQTGKYGNALSFNGTNSLITVADAPALRLTNALTLSTWVKPTTVAGQRNVVTKGLTPRTGAAYALYASNGTVPAGRLGMSGRSTQVNGTTPLATNAWSHVALTYDGATARLYVNGTQAAETPVTGALMADSGAVTIGGSTIWGEFFSGLIDEVRIYNRAQSRAEIQSDMDTPVGPGTSGSSSTPALTSAPVSGLSSDPDTSGPFSYQRMTRDDCNNARKSSPRPYHGFGWTSLHPYSACYSRILGWGDWPLDPITGLPTQKCPKSMGVMMTANVIVYTNLGTRNGAPVVDGEKTPDLTARDISVWTYITDIYTVGAECAPTTAHDGLTLQLRADATGSDDSNCKLIEGTNRTATIADFRKDGEDAFVFQSAGKAWANCTLRPKLYPPQNVPKLDPRPFRLWQYLSTEQGAPTTKGDLPFVARCDSERISYLRHNAQQELEWTGNSGGCRILGADRIYTMYTGDPHRAEVAQHIQYAFQNPQATDPKVDEKGNPITKKFAGNYDACLGLPRCAKVPLIRRPGRARVPAPDSALFTSKNRHFRDKYCAGLPGRDDPNKQCDEYPFASTYQGIGIEGQLVNDVWTPSLNASLRMVSTDHNQAAGRDLGAFYARYRVHHREIAEGGLLARPSSAFFVRIKAGAPPS